MLSYYFMGRLERSTALSMAWRLQNYHLDFNNYLDLGVGRKEYRTIGLVHSGRCQTAGAWNSSSKGIL